MAKNYKNNRNSGNKPQRRGEGNGINRKPHPQQAEIAKKKDRVGHVDEVEGNVVKKNNQRNSIDIYNQNPIAFERDMVVDGPQRVGYQYSLIDEDTPTGTTAHYAVPGVLCYLYNMSIDFADNDLNESAINRAARDIFTAARLAVGQVNTDFEQSDVALNLLAKWQIVSYFMNIKRMYNSINLYSAYNRYTPYSFAQAMNYNWKDAYHNRAHYQKEIENVTNQINSLFIPSAIKYADRLNVLANSIFTDETSIDPQFIIYVPDLVWKYNPTQREQGPGLDAIKVSVEHGETLWTIDQHLAVLQGMIDALTHDSDAQTIDTLLRKVFPAGSGYGITLNEAFWTINIGTPDADLTCQLENVILAGQVSTGAQAVQTDENTLAITYKPRNVRAGRKPIHKWLWNSRDGDVKHQRVCEGTRLMVAFKKKADNDYWIYPGLDYATRVRLIGETSERNDCSIQYQLDSNDVVLDGSTSEMISAFGTFSIHPVFYLWEGSVLAAISGNITTCVPISQRKLIDMHETAVRSSLKISEITANGVRS